MFTIRKYVGLKAVSMAFIFSMLLGSFGMFTSGTAFAENLMGTLDYAAGANGSISGSPTQMVAVGTDGSPVTAVADAGFHFTNWSDGSVSNPRTDTNVQSDHFIYTANFAADQATTVAESSTTTPIVPISATTSLVDDINGDGVVDINDYNLFQIVLNSKVGDAQYVTVADLNNDGKIDSADNAIFVANYANSAKMAASSTTTPILGDINEDGVVDINDYNLFQVVLNSRVGDARYIASADLNNDGKIDSADNDIFISIYGGKKVTGPGVTTVSPTSTGGSNVSFGGSGSGSVVPNGTVLGASAFRFTRNLRKGMSGDDVKQLQERLRAEGFFSYPTSTGYFGSATFIAVKAYQKAHGLPTTGFVGPLTRAALNK